MTTFYTNAAAAERSGTSTGDGLQQPLFATLQVQPAIDSGINNGTGFLANDILVVSPVLSPKNGSLMIDPLNVSVTMPVTTSTFQLGYWTPDVNNVAGGTFTALATAQTPTVANEAQTVGAFIDPASGASPSIPTNSYLALKFSGAIATGNIVFRAIYYGN